MFVKEESTKDYSDFAEMVWSKAGKQETDLVSKEDCVDIFISKPLLSSYWNLSE